MDFGRALEAFRSKPRFVERKGGGGFQVIVDDIDGAYPAHIHVTAEIESPDTSVWMRIDVFPPDAHAHDEDGLTFAEFFKVLRPALASPDELVVTMCSANFVFDLEKWSPTTPLPFDVPAGMEGLPGQPSICGVDFLFRAPSAAEPLYRAFVTTYPEWKEMLVRLALRIERPLDDSLPSAMIALAQEQVTPFVQRV